MKNKIYSCPVCKRKFKTEEGVADHLKRTPEKNLDDFFLQQPLKSREKYWVFYSTNKISKRHAPLYTGEYIRESSVLGRVKGNVVKSSKYIFNLDFLRELYEKGDLNPLTKEERKNLESYVSMLDVDSFLIDEEEE